MRTPAEWRELRATLADETYRRLEQRIDLMIDAGATGHVRVHVGEEPAAIIYHALNAYMDAGWEVKLETTTQADGERTWYLLLDAPPV